MILLMILKNKLNITSKSMTNNIKMQAIAFDLFIPVYFIW